MRWLQWVRSKRLHARRSANQLLLPWLPRESRYAHALLRAMHDVLFRFRRHRPSLSFWSEKTQGGRERLKRVESSQADYEQMVRRNGGGR